MQKLSVLRYCFSETQRFLSTSSLCMMAIWTAGPPKFMKPSFTQNQPDEEATGHCTHNRPRPHRDYRLGEVGAIRERA
jgi:hypothetical protein